MAGRRQAALAYQRLCRAFSATPAQKAAAVDEAAASIRPYERPFAETQVPTRLLMGPGPTNPHPRVVQAQTLPIIGHMHPPFLKITEEIKQGLQYLFQTDSKYTLLASGSGHSGMETVVANLLEPGETIVVVNHGMWGRRISDIAERYDANVVEIEAQLGTTLSLELLTEALRVHKPAMLFTCQGDSSTGINQSLAGLGRVCRQHGALLAVDTVCSLGGVPFLADEWQVDAVYSGSQKALSAPPGAAPILFGECALQKLQNRSSHVRNYYLDMNLVGGYWGWFGADKRPYHHTPIISVCYGVREALKIVAEEGLEASWARHQRLHEKLWDGLSKLGLQPFVEDEASRLATVNTVKIPDGVDAQAVIQNAMDTYSLEIGPGLGPTVGKVWRIGILGYNARDANIDLVVEAFKDGLQKQRWL